MSTITITVTGNRSLTWGRLREIIARDTPSLDSLSIATPLSGPINREHERAGHITVTQELTTADIVDDAVAQHYPLLVELDSGQIVLYGQELSDAYTALAPGEAFDIIHRGQAPTNANVAHVLSGMRTLLGDSPSWRGSEYTRALVEAVKNLYGHVLFPSLDQGIREANDMAEAYIRIAK